VSQYILRRHENLGYFRDVPVRRVIHNVLQRNGFSRRQPIRAATEKPLRVGFIGRLDPCKGLEPLISAFESLDMAEAELVVAGRGPADYERKLRSLSRAPSVRFLGRVSAPDFYSSVDVVVVPSLCNDVLPSVVYEALVSGRPVIGSTLGGIPEMIEHRYNGLLFNPEVPGDLQASLRAFLVDEALQKSLAHGASMSGRNYSDVGSWIQSYVQVYEAALAASSKAAIR